MVSPKQRYAFDLWFSRDRLTISSQHCPAWERPLFSLWTNGGRRTGECLDIGCNLWRTVHHLTIWGIPAWMGAWLRFIPSRRQR